MPLSLAVSGATLQEGPLDGSAGDPVRSRLAASWGGWRCRGEGDSMVLPMNVTVTKRPRSTAAMDAEPALDARPQLAEARMPDGMPVASPTPIIWPTM